MVEGFRAANGSLAVFDRTRGILNGRQYLDHPSVRIVGCDRVSCMQALRTGGIESESRLIRGMPQDEDKIDTGVLQEP